MTSALPLPAPISVRTVRIPDPGPLLALLPEQAPLAWVRGGEGIVGWGSSARVELFGVDQMAQAGRWWDAIVASALVEDAAGLPGSGLVCFASFGFDPLSASTTLVVPEVVVGARDGSWFMTTFGRSQPVSRPTPPRPAVGVRYDEAGTSTRPYEDLVADAVARIRGGDLDKVVLARDIVVRTDEPLDVRDPLNRLAARYGECWTFAVDGLFGATPELLLGLRDGRVTSRVLAGSVPSSGDRAADERRAAALAGSAKDSEEHGHAVTSVRKALHSAGIVPDPPSPRFVLSLPNVLHLATDVTATAPDGVTSLGLLAALHPSAAVCGTPTSAALALIRELESIDRGRYAGPVGWTDAKGEGEWGIALRCAAVDRDDPTRLRLFAGCGIVADSDPLTELAESEAKAVPIREALHS